MALKIPDGFKPSYDDLYGSVDSLAGESFIVRSNPASERSAEERLTILRGMRRSDRSRARNVLEGKPINGPRDD